MAIPSFEEWTDALRGLLAPYVLELMGGLGAALLLSIFWASWHQGAAGRRVRRHHRLGHLGERAASKILKRDGYRILETQASESYQISVDGKLVPVHLRADFLVEREGRRFVAEAKAGAVAARPTGRATRRQLLEYLYAFRVHGVLLVDVPQAVVLRVEFPSRRAGR